MSFLRGWYFRLFFSTFHPQVVYDCWTVAFGLGGLAKAKGTSSMLWVELVGQSESKERAWSHPRCCHSLQSAATFQAPSLPPWLHLRSISWRAWYQSPFTAAWFPYPLLGDGKVIERAENLNLWFQKAGKLPVMNCKWSLAWFPEGNLRICLS